MSFWNFRILPLFITAMLIEKGGCFPVTPPTTTIFNSKAAVQLCSSVEDELEDLDQVRFEFEKMLRKQGDEGVIPEKTIPLCKKDYIPKITSSCLRRRELEIELLKSLMTSDDAIDELVSLWLVERDMKSAMELQQMEEICSPGLLVEERLLRHMIEEYGVDWAEPMARLAAVLFYQGNTESSVYWAKVTLAVKPWHFETVHTLVLNALRQQDFAQAVRWARLNLPPLDRPKKRQRWVQQALKDAQDVIDRGLAAAETAKKAASTNTKAAAGDIW